MTRAARGTGFMLLVERFWSTDASLTALPAFPCLDPLLLQPLRRHGVIDRPAVFSLMLVRSRAFAQAVPRVLLARGKERIEC